MCILSDLPVKPACAASAIAAEVVLLSIFGRRGVIESTAAPKSILAAFRGSSIVTYSVSSVLFGSLYEHVPNLCCECFSVLNSYSRVAHFLR